MQGFPVSDSLGLPWGWPELNISTPLTQKLTWLNSWGCVCKPLSCCLCWCSSKLAAQLCWGHPTQGLPPVPVRSFTLLKPCSLACNFIGVGLTRLTILPNLIPEFSHILCLFKWSLPGCLAARALWEFPRQNPTLATVNQSLRAADLCTEMAIISCLCHSNTRSSGGFIWYQVLTMLGEGIVQLFSIPCTKCQLISSYTCRWEISLN